MLITAARHIAIVEDLKVAHLEHLRELRLRLAEAQLATSQWRAAALAAQQTVTELLRGDPVPATVARPEDEQPLSTLDADAAALEGLRKQREAGVGA